MKRTFTALLSLFIILALLSGCAEAPAALISLEDIPEFNGFPYVEINGNVPSFTEDDLTARSFESYGELDSLGRCTTALACIGKDLMPTQERGSIGQVKPTGWHLVKYDGVDGKYLYNRCHLIGYQLTGENANEQNLITGTRYLNVAGMLFFEDIVADYIKDTGNHVLYRVTPVFEGGNLVANGVVMEAMSVEDRGEGISFNVYCYNNQPGIIIDYATGNSWESYTPDAPSVLPDGNQAYILNKNTHKFHKPDCPSIGDIKEKNKDTYTGSREKLLALGYEPCNRCSP